MKIEDPSESTPLLASSQKGQLKLYSQPGFTPLLGRSVADYSSDISRIKRGIECQNRIEWVILLVTIASSAIFFLIVLQAGVYQYGSRPMALLLLSSIDMALSAIVGGIFWTVLQCCWGCPGVWQRREWIKEIRDESIYSTTLTGSEKNQIITMCYHDINYSERDCRGPLPSKLDCTKFIDGVTRWEMEAMLYRIYDRPEQVIGHIKSKEIVEGLKILINTHSTVKLELLKHDRWLDHNFTLLKELTPHCLRVLLIFNDMLPKGIHPPTTLIDELNSIHNDLESNNLFLCYYSAGVKGDFMHFKRQLKCGLDGKYLINKIKGDYQKDTHYDGSTRYLLCPIKSFEGVVII